jgi:hypothetical protein
LATPSAAIKAQLLLVIINALQGFYSSSRSVMPFADKEGRKTLLMMNNPFYRTDLDELTFFFY